MFSDLTETVSHYIKLKSELEKAETFLKHTLRQRLQVAKTDDILDTIVSLLNTQKSPEMIAHNKMILESDIKDINRI